MQPARLRHSSAPHVLGGELRAPGHRERARAPGFMGCQPQRGHPQEGTEGRLCTATPVQDQGHRGHHKGSLGHPAVPCPPLALHPGPAPSRAGTRGDTRSSPAVRREGGKGRGTLPGAPLAVTKPHRHGQGPRGRTCHPQGGCPSRQPPYLSLLPCEAESHSPTPSQAIPHPRAAPVPPNLCWAEAARASPCRLPCQEQSQDTAAGQRDPHTPCSALVGQERCLRALCHPASSTGDSLATTPRASTFPGRCCRGRDAGAVILRGIIRRDEARPGQAASSRLSSHAPPALPDRVRAAGKPSTPLWDRGARKEPRPIPQGLPGAGVQPRRGRWPCSSQGELYKPGEAARSCPGR